MLSDKSVSLKFSISYDDKFKDCICSLLSNKKATRIEIERYVSREVQKIIQELYEEDNF